MSSNKLKDNLSVVSFAAMFVILVLCNLIIDFNLLDFGYIVFLAICAIRYIIICKKN